MFIYATILLILASLYAFVLFRLRTGLTPLKHGNSQNQPKVSIVLAARNEEKNIKTCLHALIQQNYPENKFEIIVIDDRSEDKTFRIAEDIAKKQGKITVLQIKDTKNNIAPKKYAIDLGIKNATGEIIITTDADCKPPAGWIAGMVRHFDDDVGLVAGFNPYKLQKNNIFYEVLSLDYFAMASVAAATAGLKLPISCSGGNLAYRKEVYLQLGGFKKFGRWVSGDDDFFLEQVRKSTNWKIKYATAPETQVPTSPPQNLTEFIQQRIRYASKGLHYTPGVAIILVAVYCMNFLLLISPLLAFAHLTALVVGSFGLAIKSIAEYLFLVSAEKKFHFKFKTKSFILGSALHPLYIVIAGFLGQIKQFNWKGTIYSRKISLSVPGRKYSKLSDYA